MAAFKAGFDQRRNLAGRPRKGQSLAEAIRSKAPVAAIVKRLSELAKEGDLGAIRLLFEYGHGRVSHDYETKIQQLEQQIAELQEERDL